MGRRNPVVFTIVPQADGTYAVEASDGGLSEFLISFRTRPEAEAWIQKLKSGKSQGAARLSRPQAKHKGKLDGGGRPS
jgi:hypothetical protein